MCNRFRAICAAMLLGRLSGRQVLHNWAAEPGFPGEDPPVARMRPRTLEDFFQPDAAIPYIELGREAAVDAVFSEWGEGECWYERQSSAIRRSGFAGGIRVERECADPILDSPAETVLLETSLAMKPSFLSQTEFDRELASIYRRHFRPLARFDEMSRRFLPADGFVGLHIRRTDHLQYVAAARIDLADWQAVIGKEIDPSEPLFVFSDDMAFKRRLERKLPHRCLDAGDSGATSATDQAFAEFLALARASRIYGTAGSSFSREAALFGNTGFFVCARTDDAPSSSWRRLLVRDRLRFVQVTAH